MSSSSQLLILRKIGLFEGLSFLVLLFIAMPVKYLLGEPILVRYIGMAHGLLFMVYIYYARLVQMERGLAASFLFKACVAATLPLGTFVFDRKLKALPHS